MGPIPACACAACSSNTIVQRLAPVGGSEQAGYSTRMGAAMRHAAHYLEAQKADEYVTDIFGKRYTVIDNIQRLPERLPQLFMALTK